jgi:heme-degrading monooxygenase HmoA
MSFDGFISYEFFQGCKDHEVFMDLVLWDSLENAEIAALKVKEIQKESDFKEYINSFEKVEIFNYFKPNNL